MKTKIDKFQENGIYQIRSQASGNTLYFEFKHDHELFWNLLDRFLAEFIEVIHYVVLPKGWTLIFKTKDSKTIQDAYKAQRQKSKKAKKEFEQSKVSGMLSEHFRFFISNFVKQSNAINSRHGSKVHSRMEKFIFEHELDLKEEIARIENSEPFNEQSEPRYCANLEHYQADQDIEKDDILVNGKCCYGIRKLANSVVSCFVAWLDKMDVIRKLILSTWSNHFGPQNPPNPQNPFPQLE